MNYFSYNILGIVKKKRMEAEAHTSNEQQHSGGGNGAASTLADTALDGRESFAASGMSLGLLENLNFPFVHLAQKLHELEESQCQLINTLAIQNTKLESLPQWSHIVAVLAKVPDYNQKLHAMKQEMAETTDKVQRLKGRANKLQQRKLAVEEKERHLNAKPSQPQQGGGKA
eukprot:TRINITY_DN2402_c0_g1_i2.p1 TRINITY_DN2402_c0_g1~~TRINITY_DN2402_c0_g1_i2.p1  ORF type:complete len:172 (-),score=43.70 TRINITY_DN2402_c0_g1_i2:120-635(-)